LYCKKEGKATKKREKPLTNYTCQRQKGEGREGGKEMFFMPTTHICCEGGRERQEITYAF